jgi:sterol desaturase/sphingolipid hydroxylase (fatty acid hydroxylase superfamily)/uncharacterized membrane protein YhhN
MSKVIVYATPVFLLLIAFELYWSRARQRASAGPIGYRLNDAINSMSLGLLSQLSGAVSKLLSFGIYTLVFDASAIYPALVFWSSWYGVLLALAFYDLCYYWLHRASHVVALFWAAHVVHHQSQCYNLSTALRQTSSGVLLGWIFYLPMAVAGVPPTVFGVVLLIDLLYQFWVHTEQIGKLGWFDRVFCSPSNHRVHHAINDGYLDKNYGGILILWDRLFGSFQEEHEPCIYGTRSALNSWDPLWANLEVYWALARDSWQTQNWGNKLRIWFKPAGWQPADLAQSRPKPTFTLAAVNDFNPSLTPLQQGFAALQFALALLALLLFLWHADAMRTSEAALWCAAITAGVWASGQFMQHRLSLLEVLVVESAAVATLGALGLLGGYLLFKPLTLLLALAFVAARARAVGALTRFYALLLAALVFSLAGDVFLMLADHYFILGLASFLVAHLFYIALFRQGVPWFASRRALLGTLSAGGAMYAWVWSGLADPVLKVAVAAYVCVIALMVAQAIGRATVQGDAASKAVALGACIFMLSDSLIAINRFVQPLPLASLWVLSSYYLAQLLMVHNARPGTPANRA